MKTKKKSKKILLILAAIALVIAVFLAHRFNFIPHSKYTDKDFGIERIKSSTDADGDGIEDYEDILISAKNYVATNPKYKSKYYEGGYPDDEYGVCTDVVGFALLDSGYDLQALVDEDIRNHPADYDISAPDSNIDFRRVVNLKVFFDHTAQSLTTDCYDYENWQAGDIVVWAHHVGVISDCRNRDGIPFVIHNGNPLQPSYEQDILETFGEIVGHYRLRDIG